MKNIIVLFIAMVIASNGAAQKKRRVAFNSYVAVGFVAGKSKSDYTINTENGIAVKNWFAGLGIGIDNYFIKTYPMYAGLKKIIPVKKNGFLVYANIGINFIEKRKKQSLSFTQSDLSSGNYVDAGIGYLVKIKKGGSIYCTIGESVKTIHETEETTDVGFPYQFNTTYDLSRISFKIGYRF